MMCVNKCVYIYIYIICMYMCMYMYMYMYMYVYTYVICEANRDGGSVYLRPCNKDGRGMSTGVRPDSRHRLNG